MYSAHLPLIRVSELLQELLDEATGTDTDDSSEYPGDDIDHGEPEQVEQWCTAAEMDTIIDADQSFASEANTEGTVALFHAAAMIRTDLKAIKDPMPWPPTPVDVCSDVIVPASLYNLLSWIITGDEDIPPKGEKVTVKSADDHRRILSIAQDILCCTRRGRVKSSKHVALPKAIYHLTRSTQLVSLLNGFGHAVSASQLLEIDTALAQHELDRSGEVVLPAIDKNVSAVFCFDNFDLCEETRTGANTTHCTNGIVIQRLLTAPSQSVFQVGDYERQTRGHKRSVTAPVASETQPYFASSRFGPPRLTADMTLLQHAEIADCVKTASALDFMWLTLRLPSDVSPLFGTGECLRVPSWTPFNSIYHREHPCQQSVIGHCPVINAPPTDIATVHNVLQYAAAMAEKLPQLDVVVVSIEIFMPRLRKVYGKECPRCPTLLLVWEDSTHQ